MLILLMVLVLSHFDQPGVLVVLAPGVFMSRVRLCRSARVKLADVGRDIIAAFSVALDLVALRVLDVTDAPHGDGLFRDAHDLAVTKHHARRELCYRA